MVAAFLILYKELKNAVNEFKWPYGLHMTVLKVDKTTPVLRVKLNVKLAYTERRN